MKILLSIKPKYAELILRGDKHFEFRKSVPRRPGVRTVVIYATKPVGKIVGEFDIAEILSEHPTDLWALTAECAGISRRLFRSYFRGKDTAYAIKVREVRRYKDPLDLKSVVRNGIAPQSFCYVR